MISIGMNIATIFLGGQAAIPETAEAMPNPTEVGFDAALFQAQLAILAPPGESPPELALAVNLGVEELANGPIALRIEPDDSETTPATPAMDWLAALLTWKSEWVPATTTPVATSPLPNLTSASKAVSVPQPIAQPAITAACPEAAPAVTGHPEPQPVGPQRLVEVRGAGPRQVDQELPDEVLRALTPTKVEISLPSPPTADPESPDRLLSHTRPNAALPAVQPKVTEVVTDQRPEGSQQLGKPVIVDPAKHPPTVAQSAETVGPEVTNSKPRSTANEPIPTSAERKPTVSEPKASGDTPDATGPMGKDSKPSTTRATGTPKASPDLNEIQEVRHEEEPTATIEDAAPIRPESAHAVRVEAKEPIRLSPGRKLDAATREVIVERAAAAIERLIESRPFGQVKIQLHPEDLGSITVTVRTTGNRVEAEIAATNDSVRGALETSRPLLAPVVEAKGHQLANLTIHNPSASSWTDGHSRQTDPQAQQQFQQMVGARLTRQETEPTPPRHARWEGWSGQLDLTI
ncbi:MAG: hypothetical protein HONBIEJF_01347 [Fimbriimonadaceae bacterium]|nr:hypothetical protein [Fimbriimonadaceae bacterium]